MNKILITAGPTREPIDPVRFLSNYSSGKMGYALAKAAVEDGLDVTLISGPVCLSPPDDVKLIKIETAQEMHDAVMREIKNCDVFMSVAAVADYKSATIASQKIKKTKAALTIKLIPNPDVLAEVAALSTRPFIIGFAAETENVLKNAESKLIKKNVDMIIANKIGSNLGFDTDMNELFILQPNKKTIKLPLAPKTELAGRVIKIINSSKHHP